MVTREVLSVIPNGESPGVGLAKEVLVAVLAGEVLGVVLAEEVLGQAEQNRVNKSVVTARASRSTITQHHRHSYLQADTMVLSDLSKLLFTWL